MSYQSIHKRLQNKASRLHVIVSLVVFLFVFCTILVLNSQVKGNQAQNEALMNHDTMQQSYLDLYVQFCLFKVLSFKEIMKISPSMIESIAVEGFLFVGCILLIYFWGAFKQGPLASKSYHIRLKHLYKINKDIQLHDHISYFNLVPCKGFV